MRTGSKLSPEIIQTTLKKFQAIVFQRIIYIIPTSCKKLNLILNTFGINFSYPVAGLNGLLHQFGLEIGSVLIYKRENILENVTYYNNIVTNSHFNN